jgi:hypothetical protein
VPVRDAVGVATQRVVEGDWLSIGDLTDHEEKELKRLGEDLARQRRSRPGFGVGDEEGEDAGERSAVSNIQIRPGRNGGATEVRIENFVGVVGTRTHQLVVEPKIGVEHFELLHRLAVGVDMLRYERGWYGLEESDGYVPTVWFAYLDALRETLRADLHQDYEGRADELEFVRGRLDPLRTVLNVSRGRLLFSVTYDELSPDNPVNRVLRAAALTVARCARPLVSDPETRPHDPYRRLVTTMRESAYRLSEAGPLRPGDVSAPPPRLVRHQRRAYELAREVLRGSGRTLRPGQRVVTSFLERSPDIVEAAIRQLLDDRLQPALRVGKRSRTSVSGRLSFTPDLVIHSPSSGPCDVATGDVKYSIRTQGSSITNDWPRNILNQAVTFATAFGVPRAFFVDFVEGDPVRVEPETIGSAQYHHVSWPLGWPPAAAADHVATSVADIVAGWQAAADPSAAAGAQALTKV